LIDFCSLTSRITGSDRCWT